MKNIFVILCAFSMSVIGLVSCGNIDDSSEIEKNTVESSAGSVIDSATKSDVESNVKYVINDYAGRKDIEVYVSEKNGKKIDEQVDALLKNGVSKEELSYSKKTAEEEGYTGTPSLVISKYEDGEETMQIGLFDYISWFDNKNYEKGDYTAAYSDADMVDGFECPKEEYGALCEAIKNALS